VNDQGTVTLNTGQIEVASGETLVKMTSGERVSVEKGVLGSVEKLPAAPRLLVAFRPEDLHLPDAQGRSTTLAWEKVPDASRYHLQLSERSLFGDLCWTRATCARARSSCRACPRPRTTGAWRRSTRPGRRARSPRRAKFRITTGELRDQNDKTPPLLVVQDFILNGTIVILNGTTEPGPTLWGRRREDRRRRDGDVPGPSSSSRTRASIR
jgi:hypothetical protein